MLFPIFLRFVFLATINNNLNNRIPESLKLFRLYEVFSDTDAVTTIDITDICRNAGYNNCLIIGGSVNGKSIFNNSHFLLIESTSEKIIITRDNAASYGNATLNIIVAFSN